jgi:hypothetical protein
MATTTTAIKLNQENLSTFRLPTWQKDSISRTEKGIKLKLSGKLMGR